MDPDATLALLLDTIIDGDPIAAADHFQNLADWIASGGYPPRDPRR